MTRGNISNELFGIIFDEVVSASVCQYSKVLVRRSAHHHSCCCLIDSTIASARHKANLPVWICTAVVTDEFGCRTDSSSLIYLIVDGSSQMFYLIGYLLDIECLAWCVVYDEAIVHIDLNKEKFLQRYDKQMIWQT